MIVAGRNSKILSSDVQHADILSRQVAEGLCGNDTIDARSSQQRVVNAKCLEKTGAQVHDEIKETARLAVKSSGKSMKRSGPPVDEDTLNYQRGSKRALDEILGPAPDAIAASPQSGMIQKRRGYGHPAKSQLPSSVPTLGTSQPTPTTANRSQIDVRPSRLQTVLAKFREG